MTVRYAGEFATNSRVGCFTKLLFRWCGSVYKLIWAEYLVFISLYALISVVYRSLDEKSPHKDLFDKIADYCERTNKSLEMAFVLGFFVTSIIQNWWKLFEKIPWPSTVAVFIDANIRTKDEDTNHLKRTIMRYCNISLLLTFCQISPPVKQRYPSLSHLVKEGLLLPEEKVSLESTAAKTTRTIEWLPMVWAADLVVEAHTEGRLQNDFACQRIIDEMDRFRSKCEMLLEFEHWSVPLAYIQVATIAVYTYLISCLVESQWGRSGRDWKDLDLYFPFFATLKFIFYMGWLKVAESLINPFGSDDDDFELDKIIVANLEVMNLVVTGPNNRAHQTAIKAPTCTHSYVNEGFNGESDSTEVNTSVNGLYNGAGSSTDLSPPTRFSEVVDVDIEMTRQ